MLKTIPRRILNHTATLREPTTDSYGATSYTDTVLTQVHFQHVNTVMKTRDDKVVSLAGVMFYDCRISKPEGIDFIAKQVTAESNNGQMKLVHNGATYTVYSVDLLPDDEGFPHHYEVSFI